MFPFVPNMLVKNIMQHIYGQATTNVSTNTLVITYFDFVKFLVQKGTNFGIIFLK